MQKHIPIYETKAQVPRVNTKGIHAQSSEVDRKQTTQQKIFT
jgi:hypothetical protein